MKKAISVLLAITMVLTVVQAGIFTVSANTSGDYVYTLSASQATITDYNGAATDLVIPEFLDGYAVVAIGTGAFYSCDTLVSITIPRQVSSVGVQSFAACDNLTQILVDPNNLYFISNGGVLLNYIQTIIYAYPAGKAGHYIVPPTVTLIGGYSFEGCSNLTGITFNAILNQIGSYSFKDCTGLTTVSIPASVTVVSVAFQDCSSLTQISVDPGNTSYKSDNGVLFDYNMQYLYEYPCGKEGGYIIPAGTKYIWTRSFLDCTKLTSISIPSSVTMINSAAFLGCSGLTSVTFPSGITTIAGSAFYLCTGLTSVVIPAAVSFVGPRVFGYCSNLTSVLFLGNAPASFSSDVFMNCAPGFTLYYLSANSGFTNPWYDYTPVAFEPSLSAAPATPTNGNVTVTITYPAIATIKEYKIGGGAWTDYTTPLILTQNNTVWARCADSTGNNSPEVSLAVTNIDRVAPATPTLTADPNQPTDEKVWVTVEYPPDAYRVEVKVGHGTWEEYTGPVVLTDNDTVYARCFDAAGNESEIGSIVINFIGFYDYRYEVVHSETVLLGYNGAGGNVVIPDTLGGCPVTIIAQDAFKGCGTLTSVTIPDTVYQIEEGAFENCDILVSVQLPAGLLKIGSYAFAGCVALESVTFPAGISDLGDSVFDGCKSMRWAYFSGKLPESVGTNVFANVWEEFIVYQFDGHTFEDPWHGYKAALFEPELSAAPTTPTNGNVTVTVKYPGPAAVKEYKIGGGSWNTYTVPVILTENNTVYARCSDEFGNVSKTVSLTVTNIDRDRPATPVISVTPEYETTGYVTVTVTFPADAAIKQYILASGGGWTVYTGPIVLWANETVQARCYDAAGNVSLRDQVIIDYIITIKEGIIEKRGSTTVIDRKANCIYGLAPGLTREEFERDYIETVRDVKIYYTPDTETLGTGTRVDVYNGEDELIATYYIVIFGDINGDGSIDSLDAGSAVDYENYLLTWGPPFDEIMPFAGDVNGDGKVDSIDAGIMVDTENYMLTINQVTGLTA